MPASLGGTLTADRRALRRTVDSAPRTAPKQAEADTSGAVCHLLRHREDDDDMEEEEVEEKKNCKGARHTAAPLISTVSGAAACTKHTRSKWMELCEMLLPGCVSSLGSRFDERFFIFF